eukprot:3711831-Rhodomonas_salina.1
MVKTSPPSSPMQIPATPQWLQPRVRTRYRNRFPACRPELGARVPTTRSSCRSGAHKLVRKLSQERIVHELPRYRLSTGHRVGHSRAVPGRGFKEDETDDGNLVAAYAPSVLGRVLGGYRACRSAGVGR